MRLLHVAVGSMLVLLTTSCASDSGIASETTAFFGARGTLPDTLPGLDPDSAINEQSAVEATQEDLIGALVAANACDETCSVLNDIVVAWKRVDDLLAVLPDAAAPERGAARSKFSAWYECVDSNGLNPCRRQHDDFIEQLRPITQAAMAAVRESG
jgi:hypothetical protein